MRLGFLAATTALVTVLAAGVRPVINANLLAQSWAEAGFTYTRSGPLTDYNAAGVLVTAADNEELIGHDPATLARRGAPLCPQSANLCLHSGNLAGSGWTITAGDSRGTGATAPDGTSAYTRITVGATSSAHELFRAFTAASGTTYTASAIVRSTGSQRWVRLTIYGTALVGQAWFDMQNGVWGTISAGTTAHPVESLGNGQYRIAVSAAATGSGTGYWDLIAAQGDNDAAAWNPGSARTYDVWAAQLEALAFPTAYIPTTTAAVTRFAASVTRGGLPNLPAGALMIEALWAARYGGMEMACVRGSTSDYQDIWWNGTAMAADVRVGGTYVSQLTRAGTPALYAVHRGVTAWGVSDFGFAFDGSDVATDAAGAAPANTNLLEVGSLGGNFHFAGWVRRVALYRGRPGNGEVRALSVVAA